MRARLFVKMPAINSKTKTEAMATSDNRKAFFFITSTSGLVAVLVVVFERPVTANKNRVEFII
jgi:hypothetical protein